MSNEVLSSQDYEAIEAAVMETERGRWFLHEYAARHRQADTLQVLGALAQLETRLLAKSSGAIASLPPPSPIPDTAIFAQWIAEIRTEMRSLREEAAHNGRILHQGGDFDALSAAHDHAINSVLNAAERIQEVSWILREHGTEQRFSDELDQRANEIYLACSFQDTAARRLALLVDLIQRIDTHIARSDKDEEPPRPPRLAEPQAPLPAASQIAAPANEAVPAKSAPAAAPTAPPSAPSPAKSPSLKPAVEPSPPLKPKPEARPATAGSLALAEEDDLLEEVAPMPAHGINFDELSFSEKVALFS